MAKKSRSRSRSRSSSKSRSGSNLGVNIPTNTRQVKSFLSNMTKSRCILYSLFVLAVVNIVVYLQTNNISQIVLFLAIGGLCYFFTKNMVVILGTAILVSNLLNVSYVNNQLSASWNVREGMDTTKEGNDASCPAGQVYENGSCRKESFQGRISPAKVSKDDREDEDDMDNSYVDKSKTIENAYSSLDNILGTKGMQGLSDETHKLIDKQNQLMDSIKTMGPVMSNMNSMMKNMGEFTKNKDMTKVSDELSKSLDKFKDNTTNSSSKTSE